MKLGTFENAAYEPWYRELDVFEQEWFQECLEKRVSALDEVTSRTAELQRLRQRGHQRALRRARMGGA